MSRHKRDESVARCFSIVESETAWAGMARLRSFVVIRARTEPNLGRRSFGSPCPGFSARLAGKPPSIRLCDSRPIDINSRPTAEASAVNSGLAAGGGASVRGETTEKMRDLTIIVRALVWPYRTVQYGADTVLYRLPYLTVPYLAVTYHTVPYHNYHRVPCTCRTVYRGTGNVMGVAIHILL